MITEKYVIKHLRTLNEVQRLPNMYLSWTTTEHQVPADVIQLILFFSSTID